MSEDKGDWGLGIGDWGLGIAQSPIPNPQSPNINCFKLDLLNYLIIFNNDIMQII